MRAISTSKPDHVSISPGTSMGTVRLTVSDVDRSRAFYERALGLRTTERDDGTVLLGADAGTALVELRGDAAAPSLDPRAPGLFHLAILLPSRTELAVALARLVQVRIPLTGASDHLVSEALYLSDPDGNGIEIYRDRPREEWPARDGVLQMATLPLDLDSVIAEIRERAELPGTAPEGTRVGHVHVQVSDLDEAEHFYSDVLGFDVMVRGYPGSASGASRSCSRLPPSSTTCSGGCGQPASRRRRAPEGRWYAIRSATASYCAVGDGFARSRGATLTAAATWRSGYAEACKAFYTGSIPVVALRACPD